MKLLLIIAGVLLVVYAVVYYFQFRAEIKTTDGMPDQYIDMDRIRDCFGGVTSDSSCSERPDISDRYV